MRDPKVPMAFVNGIPPEIKPTNGVKFSCPCCSGEVVTATEPQALVMHALPMCNEFGAMEPIEFITHCRKLLEKKMP